MQKRASQIFLDPIQKHASSRSVQLKAVLLKALLYFNSILYTSDNFHNLDDFILKHYYSHNKKKLNVKVATFLESI